MNESNNEDKAKEIVNNAKASPADKIINERKKGKQGELDKQAKIVADALDVVHKELTKYQGLEEDIKALDSESRAMLKKFNL